jgi:AmmeMemoRadiSam system protein A
MAGIIWGGLVPHPPLIIPGIGQEEVKQVQCTINSMKAIAKEICDLQPDNLVIISPHGPAFRDGIPLWDFPEMKGSFAQFGYPSLTYSTKVDQGMVQAIRTQAESFRVPLVSLNTETVARSGIQTALDHGVMVPLHYLQEAGCRAPVILVSIGWLSQDQLFRFGQVLQRAAAVYGSRTAVLASGDLSHCLQKHGPAGYNPAGKRFDELLKSYFESNQLRQVLHMDPHLIDQAAECGFRPIAILLGSLSGLPVESKVHSYEGPFGVGYMVVGFKINTAGEMVHPSDGVTEDAEVDTSSPLVKWAKDSLETFVRKRIRNPIPVPLPEEMNRSAGVFVSLKKNGLLRGCIGTIFPVHSTIAEEIRENAISAGTKDPRFYPVSEAELPYLDYSVDVLTEPESVSSREQLDPRIHGVIVRKGNRLGLLLPDLEGIDTVEEQLCIACQKAGIDPGKPYDIERFQVIRYE